MKEQKFKHGDVVKIADEMPAWMSHFESGQEVCILSSYRDQFGGDNVNDYTVMFLDGSICSWYPESLLTFVRHDPELVKTIKAQRAEYEARVSQLDWIFEHGEEVLKDRPFAALQALANVHNLGSLWGSRGEGIDLDRNIAILLDAAESFLLAGDKDGWLNLRVKR